MKFKKCLMCNQDLNQELPHKEFCNSASCGKMHATSNYVVIYQGNYVLDINAITNNVDIYDFKTYARLCPRFSFEELNIQFELESLAKRVPEIVADIEMLIAFS